MERRDGELGSVCEKKFKKRGKKTTTTTTKNTLKIPEKTEQLVKPNWP